MEKRKPIQQTLQNPKFNNSFVPFHKNKIKRRMGCPKCKKDPDIRSHRSKSFHNTSSLTKHILRCHQNDRNSFPTTEEVFFVLQQIAEAITKGIPLESIPKVVELEMIIQ